MFSPEFLKMLLCPDDRTPLRPADAATVARLNAAAAQGQLRNRGGEVVTRTLDGGLIRADGAYLYPIVDGIPILLVDEGLPLG